MQVSRGAVSLHLSEHHGDGCPGVQIRVEMIGIDAFHTELLARNYGHARPGLERQPWGERSVGVTDPFGNRLFFCERIVSDE